MVTAVLSLSLHPNFSGLKLNVCYILLQSHSMQLQMYMTAVKADLTPNATVTLIEQSHNTLCKAACYNQLV